MAGTRGWAWRFGAAAVMVVLALAGLSATGRAQGQGAVTVAVAPSADMAPLIIAVKKGFFEKQGLKSQMKVFDSSPKGVEALVAGQADITQNTEPPHLAARARGGKVVQVMTIYVTGLTNGILVNGNVVKSVDDFAGKKVAVQKGSGSNFHLAWFFDRHKIPMDKVQVVYMAVPDHLPALARNDVQIAFTWEPFITRAVETIPGAKVWARAVNDGLEFRGNVLMREDLAKNDKDTAVKIVKALVETSDWMNANGREAARVANEVLRAPSEDDAYKQLQIFKWPADFKKAEKDLELKIAEWGISIGLFPAKDAKALVDSIIYPDIMRAAAPDRTDM